MHDKAISIWFFIGFSLLVNGALITSAGVYQIFFPPAEHVVLFQMHANVWWGAVLFIAGILYCVKFYPGRGKTLSQSSSAGQ